MASKSETTESSSARFPPTAGKTTITTSSIGSKKTNNTSSASSAIKTKVSTGAGVPVSPGPDPPSSTRAKDAKGAFTRAKTVVGLDVSSAESARMKQDKEKVANWKRWGPYLSERQWATVREDYSAHGNW